MNNLFLLLLIPFLIATGCRNVAQSETIVSMQVLDRNGFSETISNKDRLSIYENVDFLTAQPYEKVLRVYNKNTEGKSPSKLTSYHDNGGTWQYLEALDGRAHGQYLEWHENGKLKISAYVIEGLADLNPTAQMSWLFDKGCTVYDESGHVSAEFTYDKGHLVDSANYYYPDGSLQKQIPYQKGKIHGTLKTFDPEGNILEEISYKNDLRDGPAATYFSHDNPKAKEEYKDGLLFTGAYYSPEGTLLSEIANGNGTRAIFDQTTLARLVEFRKGEPEGLVKQFAPNETLHISYILKNGMKTGEEWEYYDDNTPKLLINWFEDQIQGMVKTWYPHGALQSQREMSNNKKHGLSFCYYKTGDLMMMEEYENDLLIKASYYKKGQSEPISTIDEGTGTATLYSPEGHFTEKVEYEKGRPIVE